MASYTELVSGLHQVFLSGRTKKLEWRRQQLEMMLKMFDENRDRLCEALKQDLNKVKKNLLSNFMDKCYIRREPFGVALIISAWNYPVQLIFMPMIGAIAAGNCVVLKPSEISWNTAVLIEELVSKYFDKECIKVINGGVPETTALLKEKWDYIFYTGNSPVGKSVMKAAAEYLTPITLELGGKSPVYIDKDVDLGVVANRIMWAKTMNAGQTCIAPDYIMCSKETHDRLIEKMEVSLSKFYPEGPAKSADYPRVVNDIHFQRLKKLVDGASNVAIGGDTDEQDRYIAPTVLTDVNFKDEVMQEEIFGPVLPIIPVPGEDEAIAHINDGSKPLAMYIFSNNQKLVDKVLEYCTSGTCCVNDCIMQNTVPTLPFGGVGTSGMGAYHGKFSYDTFSHKRAVMERQLKMESMNNIRYPPFTDKKLSRVSWFQGKKLKTGLFAL